MPIGQPPAAQVCSGKLVNVACPNRKRAETGRRFETAPALQRCSRRRMLAQHRQGDFDAAGNRYLAGGNDRFSVWLHRWCGRIRSDAQIRQTMIDDSIKAYQGACPLPYSVDRGNKCAEHSAYRTLGGVRPKCFPSDISDKQVADKRRDLAAKGAAKNRYAPVRPSAVGESQMAVGSGPPARCREP